MSKKNHIKTVQVLCTMLLFLFVQNTNASNLVAIKNKIVANSIQKSSTKKDTIKSEFIAPSINPNFASALKVSKLQSDYLEEDQKDLDNYSSAFFYLKDNKMVLINSGGEKTRTELRNVNQFNKNTKQKMVVSAVIESQPAGEVTVAQLHNKNSKLPVLRISVSGNTVYYKLNKEPVKGTKLTDNAAFSTKLPKNGALEITLELTGDNYLKATVNGETKNLYIENAWGKDFENMYYFKTGVYCQSEGTAKIVYNSLTWD